MYVHVCAKRVYENNPWVKEKEITRKIVKIHWVVKNEYTTYLNWCNATKAVLRGKFKTVNVCIIKKKRPEINILKFHLTKLEKSKLNPKQEDTK